jgi:hypothetical protein
VPEQMPDRLDEGHPIISGIAALVGVALAVGLLLGLVVLAGTRVAGLGGGSDTGTSTSQHTMYLPRPQKTPAATGPQITLAPDGSTPTRTAEPKPSRSASTRKELTLSASITTAAPMETFDLSGVYRGGEGSILQVQRFSGNTWLNFPVTASVTDETFQTSVQTSQPGPNRFRVIDTDTGRKSNTVRVTVG